jgi:1,4-alpha-glucan branching enzyme
MISCSVSSEGPPLRVTFRVTGPELRDRRVSLVGDFNGWDRAATVLSRQPDGSQAATVALEPQRYRFRYVTEGGHWFDDEAAHGYELDECGQRNCVLDLAVMALPRFLTDSPATA